MAVMQPAASSPCGPDGSPGTGDSMPSSTVLPVTVVRRMLPPVASVVVLTSAFLVLLAVKPGGADLVVRLSDVVTAAAAAAATVACACAARRHVGPMRRFWWLLVAATAAWTCAELGWTAYEVLLREPVPAPSWADVGYLAAPAIALAAFACHPATHRRGRLRLTPVLDGIAVASALLFVSWVLLLGPRFAITSGLSLSALVSLAYPFCDVVILALVVAVLRTNLRSGERATTLLLASGLTCMALSDSAYTYLSQLDVYASGDLIDAGWLASYLAIAAAAFLSRGGRATASPGSTYVGPLQRVVPTVPVLVALVVILVTVSSGGALDATEWRIAVCLTLVVVARQAIELGSRRTTMPPTPPGSRHERRAAGNGGKGRPCSPVEGSGRSDPGDRATASTDPVGLALALRAAARPTGADRAQRVSYRMVTVLTTVAAILALWDLTLLLRGSGAA